MHPLSRTRTYASPLQPTQKIAQSRQAQTPATAIPATTHPITARLRWSFLRVEYPHPREEARRTCAIPTGNCGCYPDWQLRVNLDGPFPPHRAGHADLLTDLAYGCFLVRLPGDRVLSNAFLFHCLVHLEKKLSLRFAQFRKSLWLIHA